MEKLKNLLPRYRVMLVKEAEGTFTSYPRFQNSRDLFDNFREELSALDREHFFMITLDSKNRTIGYHTISMGSLSSSVVHPREVFKSAILENSAAIIFLHNHPSGDPAPSREDRECTNRLTQAAKILGIRVLDHVIFGEMDYFSFADAGILADMGNSLP
jgi:DNA repair protein RadC